MKAKVGCEFNFRVKTSPSSPELVFLVIVPPCTLQSHILAAILGFPQQTKPEATQCYVYFFQYFSEKGIHFDIATLKRYWFMLSAWKMILLHQVTLHDEFVLLSCNPAESLAWQTCCVSILHPPSWGFP